MKSKNRYVKNSAERLILSLVLSGVLAASGVFAFYVWINHRMISCIYRMLGAAAFSGNDNKDLAVVFGDENVKEKLYRVGQDYLIQCGYAKTGIPTIMSSSGLFAGIMLFTGFLIIVFLLVFYFIRNYQKCLTEDCRILSEYLDNSELQEKPEEPTFSNPEMELLFGRMERFQENCNHRLQIINQEKSHLNQFTQNVYHQIKTPLAGLKVNLEMMGDSTDKVKVCLSLIDRITEQITILLKLGKFEANLIKIPKTEQDLSIVVEDAVCGIEALARYKNLRIVCTAPENCILSFHYFWMREAIENILKNACENSPRDKEVRITLNKSASSYTLTIDDQAGGVRRSDIFDRYATSEGEDRFGIGLHLSKVIIENHFGSVSVSRNKIGGTKFIISLPLISGIAPYVTEN